MHRTHLRFLTVTCGLLLPWGCNQPTPVVQEPNEIAEPVEIAADPAAPERAPEITPPPPAAAAELPAAAPEEAVTDNDTPAAIPQTTDSSSATKDADEAIALTAAAKNGKSTAVEETTAVTEAPPATEDAVAETPSDSAQATDTASSPAVTKSPLDTEIDNRWKSWPKPSAVILFTGEQHGYIEPCGCTGLENQKGGLARRHTLIKEIEALGWNVVPMDAGNQVRRYGQQAGIKFQTTVSSLRTLGYRAVGFGPDDLRLDVGLLLSEAASDPDSALQFVSANVTLLDPELLPATRVIVSGGKRIGVTSILDPKTIGQPLGDEIIVDPVAPAVKKSIAQMAKENCDYKVLMYYGGNSAEEDINALGAQLDGIDLVVIANEFGEPTYKPQKVRDSANTEMILTGHKAMYACLIALYDDGSPSRYVRIPLTSALKDSPAMLQSLAVYQDHLKNLGLSGLGLNPIPHASGSKFVGSEKCGECHTTAMAIWEATPHAHATESIVHPPNDRGDIARHFDPECLSCHVTGWNPQGYYPYLSGYLSLESTPHMVANGCENCHGPGSQHVAAEEGDITASDDLLEKLRNAMRLPLDQARERCMDCHDLDNSPDFHKDGAFEKYWEQVKHVGKD
ncbi:Cytochrome c-554 precursor [Rosistilla carotiformis]|uniref:Cytochrome c-554 n=1 Tax=Rosistilla carotiformis TaxID=2528017 RepID=A0A518JMA4_9BACT|nr:multiheme c-type cytochrome [Rosistilla carotiformis]QDV66686.1 Cytochrome c-554 precursor [Rosistilla carotiformis]